MCYHSSLFTAALLSAAFLMATPASAQQRTTSGATVVPHIVDLPVDRAVRPAPEGGCTGSEDIVQNITNSGIGLSAGFNEAVGQSFTAPCTGTAEAVTVAVEVFTGGAVNFTMYQGLGDTGTVLYSSTENIAASGPYTVDFSSPVDITAGQSYTFKFSIPSSSPVDISFNESSIDPYAGGTEYNILFGGGGTFFGPDASYDLVFTVDVGASGPPACDIEFTAADLTYNAGTRRLCAVVTVRNNGASASAARLELDYDRNGGAPQGTRVLGSGTLPAGAQATRTVCLTVPGAAPPGNYNFDLRLVDPGTGADCDSYTETIAISAPRVAGSAAGEPFSIEEVADFTPQASASAPASVSPNPFTRQATITYEVAEAADVRLAAYDVLGREVAVLVDGPVEAGTHVAVFDAAGLAAGTYVYRLVVGADVRTGRMTLTR